MSAFAVTALRNLLPDAHIVWACQRTPAPVIAVPTLVNHLHIFDRETWKKQRGPAAWAAQIRTYLALRSHHFDLGFDFQGHSKTALALRLARPTKRFSSRATDALALRLTPPVITTPDDDIHEVERAFNLVHHALPDALLPAQPLMPDVAAAAASLRQTHPRLVTLQTGATEAVKRYPPELWATVADALIAQGHSVAVLGGPRDPELSVPHALNLVGKTTLPETLAYLAASDLHIAADTGTAHIAAAYDRPVLALFSKNLERRFRPYSEKAHVLRAGTPEERRPAAEIPPQAIINRALEILK